MAAPDDGRARPPMPAPPSTFAPGSAPSVGAQGASLRVSPRGGPEAGPVSGLSAPDRERASGDFFDRFPWERSQADAERMPAGAFLDSL